MASRTERAFTYLNITSNATTVVKTGKGVLHRITINSPGTSWVATIYDNTAGSGTKIGTLAAVAGQGALYECEFSTGLTIVTSGTAGDLTVSFA